MKLWIENMNCWWSAAIDCVLHQQHRVMMERTQLYDRMWGSLFYLIVICCAWIKLELLLKSNSPGRGGDQRKLKRWNRFKQNPFSVGYFFLRKSEMSGNESTRKSGRSREQSRWWFGGYRTAKPQYLTTFLVPMGWVPMDLQTVEGKVSIRGW